MATDKQNQKTTGGGVGQTVGPCRAPGGAPGKPNKPNPHDFSGGPSAGDRCFDSQSFRSPSPGEKGWGWCEIAHPIAKPTGKGGRLRPPPPPPPPRLVQMYFAVGGASLDSHQNEAPPSGIINQPSMFPDATPPPPTPAPPTASTWANTGGLLVNLNLHYVLSMILHDFGPFISLEAARGAKPRIRARAKTNLTDQWFRSGPGSGLDTSNLVN